MWQVSFHSPFGKSNTASGWDFIPALSSRTQQLHLCDTHLMLIRLDDRRTGGRHTADSLLSRYGRVTPSVLHTAGMYVKELSAVMLFYFSLNFLCIVYYKVPFSWMSVFWISKLAMTLRRNSEVNCCLTWLALRSLWFHWKHLKMTSIHAGFGSRLW